MLTIYHPPGDARMTPRYRSYHLRQTLKASPLSNRGYGVSRTLGDPRQRHITTRDTPPRRHITARDTPPRRHTTRRVTDG